MHALYFAPDAQPFVPEAPFWLASDLRVPLGHARLLCPVDVNDPDQGVWYQLDAVLAARAPSKREAAALPPSGRVLVAPALLLRPLLYLPVRAAALRSAWEARCRGALLEDDLDAFLYPRPPGHPPRLPLRCVGPWAPPALPAAPKGDDIVAFLREHPGEAERRRFGGELVLDVTAKSRTARVALPERAAAQAQPLSLAHELVLLCPDRRGEPPVVGAPAGIASIAAKLVQELIDGERPRGPHAALLARSRPWAASGDPDEVLVHLRTEALRALRALTPRPDRRRLRRVQASLLPDLRLAARPFDNTLLWRAGAEGPNGSVDALGATAALLRDALRGADWPSLLDLATNGALCRFHAHEGEIETLFGRLRTAPFWVAQVVVPPVHALFARARGAAPLADPRVLGGYDYEATWGRAARRLEADIVEGQQPVIFTFAGVGDSAAAVVERWLGPGDWPLSEPVRLG